MCVGWSGDGGPASQLGVRASDGEQWLARLVTSLRAGDVSGAWCSGGPWRWPGARCEYSNAGRNSRCSLLLSDAGAVADLGLPMPAADVGLVDPVRVDGAVAVEPVPISGEPQKVSMGVTLPTVPARLVKRILAGEFVDMGELSQEALRAEFGRGRTRNPPRPSFARWRIGSE